MPMDSCKYCVEKTSTKGCIRFFCISKKLNTQFWKTPKQELCDNTGSARETWERPERKQLTTPGLFCLPEGILLRWSSWESTCLALTGGEQAVAPSFQETTALLQKAPLFANVGKKGLFLEFSPRKKCQSRYGTTKNPYKNWALICCYPMQLPCLDEHDSQLYSATCRASLVAESNPSRLSQWGRKTSHLCCIILSHCSPFNFCSLSTLLRVY